MKLFCGIIAVNDNLIKSAVRDLENILGRIDMESDVIPFTFTEYYSAEMGEKLLRKFVCFTDLIDPSRISGIKLETNRLEEKYSELKDEHLQRRVNLDPGYLCASRLVLATTKDFSHRIYLAQGIYGEVTLNFRKDGMSYHPWTYPDFKSDAYRAFFMMVRGKYMEQMTA